ncbi:serine--tRNA ligase [Alicyclobacillus mengziensis]|uniref:Serine--tRNA ligase n=1 Tax=Alicyclobacillus mengziensis TaxID=2931921 RepID=A0A9X7VY16_9BACL|nr:serine--tRNA ligase [Alicyclobacillus mengziensis]QSO46799.1 serine--tRNA ligase [Alicyclobacillus mengziensis]
MMDIQFVRENPELMREVARQKGIDVDIARLLDTDVTRRETLQQREKLRQQRNQVSKAIAQLAQSGQTNGPEAARLKDQVRTVNAELAEVEHRWLAAQQEYDALMLLVPNIVSPDTPIGASDADNVELRRVGDLPQFSFDPLDHVALGERLEILDIVRGVKVAGSRGYFLKGGGLHLHRAVQQLAIDLLNERGFTVMDVPVMVREEALSHTGFFPLGADETYQLPADDLYLVGTAEAPLVSYFSREIVDVSRPIRVAGVSNCFRREAGSAGRDVRGLYRVHQFAKVEQVVICEHDIGVAKNLLSEITQNAEDLLQALELPYRVMAVCTGDMSQKNYQQFDIETWMPSRNSYGETHSSSLLLDFQARRANTRYRDKDGQLQYCFTLNNTAVASPRILIPLLEVHQRRDGSVGIPTALQRYIHGVTELKPR